MLTFHQNTAVCDIVPTSFVSKNGKTCLCSELFFIDGSSMKYFDFGELARHYQRFVLHKWSKPPFSWEELDKTEKEEKVNGTDE